MLSGKKKRTRKSISEHFLLNRQDDNPGRIDLRTQEIAKRTWFDRTVLIDTKGKEKYKQCKDLTLEN